MGFTVDLLYPRGKRYLKPENSMPDDYVEDLNLRKIARLILPQNEDYALKILTQFVDDPEVIRYRQDILEDFLTYPQLEGVFYEVIRRLYDFERSIESKNRNAMALIDISVRLEAIENYIACVNSCCDFAKKNPLRSAGLRELMNEMTSVHDSKNFEALIRETETLKNTMDKTVESIVIGVNLDKMKRPCQMAILSFSDQPIKQRTLLDKLLNQHENREPIGKMHCCDRYDMKTPPTPFEISLFDDLNSLSDDILNHFSVALKTYYKNHIDYFLDIQAQLDFYLGAKRFVKRFEAKGMHFCRPEPADKESRIFEVHDLFDLPLAIQMWNYAADNKTGMNIVTNDVSMGDEDGRIFILTGPNHGGKTTYTRAVGVCQVLFQAGLMIPGTSARISPVDYIFTHFPKEEVVGINTSRLTQECKQCRVTFSLATRYSLILMNEAFSSTTYGECLYIASGFLRLMRKIGCRGVFATHMIELAKEIEKLEAQTPGDSKMVSMVAQIEKSSGKGEAHQLTYKIRQGEPYSYSYAQEILHKYGIDFEELLGKES